MQILPRSKGTGKPTANSYAREPLSKLWSLIMRAKLDEAL